MFENCSMVTRVNGTSTTVAYLFGGSFDDMNFFFGLDIAVVILVFDSHHDGMGSNTSDMGFYRAGEPREERDGKSVSELLFSVPRVVCEHISHHHDCCLVTDFELLLIILLIIGRNSLDIPCRYM
jgi:hypothetical protein